MAAIALTGGDIVGVSSTDVVELYRGDKVEIKRVTVEELLRGTTGIIPTLPVWDDLRFPAHAINPNGAINGPSQDQSETAFPGTLLFSGSRDDMISGIAQMPHSWRKGTAIRPHIHWSKPVGSASAVTWELFVRLLGNPGSAAGSWSTAYTGTIVAGDASVTDEHVLTTFGDVSLESAIESACFAWRLYRRGSTDADSGTARLYEFDVHYQLNQLGTANEIPS